MLKNDFMHSNLKVRSACKRLICAINDNPSAFDGIILGEKTMRTERNKEKSIRDIGFIGMAVILFSKILGWH